MIAAVLAAGAVLAGILKVGFGQGAGILALPLYALVVPPKYANGVLAPLLVLGDLIAIRAYWGKWEVRLLPIFLPGQLLGVVLGAYALAHLPEAITRRAIGAVLIIVVVAQLALRNRPRTAQISPVGAAVASLEAGFTSALAQMGTSFLSIYLVRMRTAKEALVPTLSITFIFSNVFKILLYWRYGVVTRETWLADAWLAPALIIGGLLGIAANRRLSQRVFDNAVLAFAAVAGAKLLVW